MTRIKAKPLDQFIDQPGSIYTLVMDDASSLADALAQRTKTAAYRVDLGAIATPFIGETEKNIDELFDKARQQDWVLLFDEADALFGKRSDVRDSHDRFANIDQSYLLKRIRQHTHSAIFLLRELPRHTDSVLLRKAIRLATADSNGPE